MLTVTKKWLLAIGCVAACWTTLPAQQTPPPARADLAPARELTKAGKFDEADRMLAELETTFPDDPSLLLLHGEVLLAKNNAPAAVERLRHAAEVAPQKLRVQFELATALSAIGDSSGALEAFAKEIELNQDSKIRGMARVNRSILYQKAQKWSDAAAELEALLEVDPERKEAYGDLAQMYLNAGHPDDAQHVIERGAEKGYQSSRLWFGVGVAYYNEKSYDKSVVAFRKAIELQSDLAEAELNLAKTLDQLDRREEANPHLARYLELRPDAKEAADIRKRLASPAKATPKPKKSS